MNAFDDLVQIVAKLRSPGGCPWDRAQSHRSMRPYILEETYEVLDAIDRGDTAEIRHELGDVLFQIVLLARMSEEAGDFTLEDVVSDINHKMIQRHPHVFDPNHVREADEGSIAAWERRKSTEGAQGPRSALSGVPNALPALLRAHRISEKASAVGFDWPDVAGVRAKLSEELQELDEALVEGDERAITEEFGDLLFTAVNLGRHLPTGAEEALRVATDKFASRFRRLEDELHRHGTTVHASSPDTLEATWQRIKQEPPC